MTAADQLDTAVARPDADDAKSNADKLGSDDLLSSKGSLRSHLCRRSSFQKIMHICNQSYSAFPHVLLLFRDVHTTITVDIKNLILFLRSAFLNVAVTLAVFALITQLALFFMMSYYLTGKGPIFLTACVLILGLLAHSCFTVNVVKRVQRSVSCRRKDY